MKKGKLILLILLLVISLLIVILVLLYRKDRIAAQKRFATYSKKANHIKTTLGHMSYIDEGSGEVILSCHGICGGYDQAYDTLADNTDTYRILAPSRFGYPGTDMPENGTIEMQATAYTELLNQLGIDKAYILATSAGGTSAIKFALTYPERTKGLILYCSAYPALEKQEKVFKAAGPPAALCSDLAMWMISPLFQPLMGMERSTIHTIMPIKERKQGIIFDGNITNTVMINDYKAYDMSELKVSVLVLHAKDDKLAKFEVAESWAKRIPDCTSIFFESGGHLMSNNEEEIEQSLKEFIERTKG